MYESSFQTVATDLYRLFAHVEEQCELGRSFSNLIQGVTHMLTISLFEIGALKVVK